MRKFKEKHYLALTQKRLFNVVPQVLLRHKAILDKLSDEAILAVLADLYEKKDLPALLEDEKEQPQ